MRLKIIIYFVILICILLLGRVYFLSIKSNTYYEELSQKNYIKKIHITAPRGSIIDRNGNYLAINKIGFSITIKPHMRKRKYIKDLNQTLELITKYFPKFTYKNLYDKYKKNDSNYKHKFVSVVDYIAYGDFFKYYSIFNSKKYIKIKSAIKRYYPYKDVAGHILGYTGKINKADIHKNETEKYYSSIGRSGLERYYNKTLQGSLGENIVKVNAYYKVIKTLEHKDAKSQDIHITIDIKLQKYIHKLFEKKAGAVIVMNVNTGELLSAGSFPEFDNNIFVNGISNKKWKKIINNLEHPFTNKLVNGIYPPGSIIKMGTAISFLQNQIKLNFSVNCKSDLKLGEWKFRCWKKNGHGRTHFRKALRESCDDFFYKGSLKVGINNIFKTLDKFGMGHKTGVDQPNEFRGINPNKNWKNTKYNKPWYLGETLVSAIGQGYLLVTPMQIARYTASLATGTLLKPHFLDDKSIINNIDLNISKKYLKVVRLGMYDVANTKNGTAKKHIKEKLQFKIAAKTGTAQVIGIPQDEKKRMREDELNYFKRSHAWLTSYAPYKNPQFVVTILVEHGGHGGSAAGEILGKIYKKLYDLGYIKLK
jgi:penicillin-binding protein 2